MTRTSNYCAGFCLALLTLGFVVLPGGYAADSKKTVQEQKEAELYAHLKTQTTLFNEIPDTILVVETVEGKKLHNLVILRKNDGEIVSVTHGREGQLWVDPKGETVSIRVSYGHSIDVENGTRAYFEERTVTFPLKK
jgi:hypothetical protein